MIKQSRHKPDAGHHKTHQRFWFCHQGVKHRKHPKQTMQKAQPKWPKKSSQAKYAKTQCPLRTTWLSRSRWLRKVGSFQGNESSSRMTEPSTSGMLKRFACHECMTDGAQLQWQLRSVSDWKRLTILVTTHGIRRSGNRKKQLQCLKSFGKIFRN